MYLSTPSLGPRYNFPGAGKSIAVGDDDDDDAEPTYGPAENRSRSRFKAGQRVRGQPPRLEAINRNGAHARGVGRREQLVVQTSATRQQRISHPHMLSPVANRTQHSLPQQQLTLGTDRTAAQRGVASGAAVTTDAISNGVNMYSNSRDLLLTVRRTQSRREAARFKRRFEEDAPLPQLPTIPRIGIDPDLHTEQTAMAGCCSMRGVKPGHRNWTNQDNFLMLENPDGSDYRVYTVLDGHGEHGHIVSTRCREILPFQLRKNGFDMRLTCRAVQEHLCNSDVDVRCSGATCISVVVVNKMLQVVNLGDSRAVLGRKTKDRFEAIPLSADHKPDNPEERKRITQSGGKVGCRQAVLTHGYRGPVAVSMGPMRVWYHFRGETLGLAMSRSLGDSIAHQHGVSAEPEITEHKLEDGDEFVILATDGLWDVVDNTQAVNMVEAVARQPSWDPLEAASLLCKFARSRWERASPMIDDITCMVVRLRPCTFVGSGSA